jgi:hypothetical protein
MMSRQPCLACKVILSLVLLCPTVQGRAELADVTLKDLAAKSDLIVVARVTKIESDPHERRPTEYRLPALRMATAQVIETWKGDKVREIHYIASPTRIACDMTGAERGEQVVLLLEERRDSIYRIVYFGRGRMPIHDAEGKRYATLADEVILPKGTPTFPRAQSSRWVLPTKLTGEPERPITFEYTVRTIELGTLRKLMKNDSRPSRPASPQAGAASHIESRARSTGKSDP